MRPGAHSWPHRRPHCRPHRCPLRCPHHGYTRTYHGHHGPCPPRHHLPRRLCSARVLQRQHLPEVPVPNLHSGSGPAWSVQLLPAPHHFSPRHHLQPHHHHRPHPQQQHAAPPGVLHQPAVVHGVHLPAHQQRGVQVRAGVQLREDQPAPQQRHCAVRPERACRLHITHLPGRPPPARAVQGCSGHSAQAAWQDCETDWCHPSRRHAAARLLPGLPEGVRLDAACKQHRFHRTTKHVETSSSATIGDSSGSSMLSTPPHPAMPGLALGPRLQRAKTITQSYLCNQSGVCAGLLATTGTLSSISKTNEEVVT
mmetsp:Transcript_13769/g.41590  ORF Transcript_13769/g.41590 Transcript_13769/m.41590 type:complete len:311 (+) Transcript_13769:573-1505(+)